MLKYKIPKGGDNTVRVVRKEGESIDSLVSRFKKSVNNSQVLADYKKHEFYMKPGLKKRVERAENRRRRKRR